jgi:patatin-like phospholipase/acyl hydrolase
MYCKKNNNDDCKYDTIRQEIIESKKEKILSKSEQLEEFQEKVLNELMISSNEYESRKHFLKFFRKNMLSIREELYEEFKDHITDTDFDLYFRSAISKYETGYA